MSETVGRPTKGAFLPTATLLVPSLWYIGSVTDHICSPVSPLIARTTPLSEGEPAM